MILPARLWAAEVNNLNNEFQEAKLIALAAGACAGSYGKDDSSPEYSYLRKYDFDIQQYIVEEGTSKVHFILAQNENFDGKKLFILAFRGSSSQQDWRSNFEIVKIPYNKEVQSTTEKGLDPLVPAVHRGFNNYTNAVMAMRNTIIDKTTGKTLWQELENNSQSTLLLTGHSMGGAVATLMAERLMDEGVSKNKMKVITFGAPAIANKAFAEVYSERIDLLRIKTNFDPIPGSLQTFIGGFQQFGREETFKLSGRVSSYQHPVSYYLDLSVKNYFDDLDHLIANGFVNPMPRTKKIGEAPVVAIYVVNHTKEREQPFGQYMSRFLLEEYLTFIPNYLVLNVIDNKENDDKPDYQNLLKQMEVVNADYLLYLNIGAKRLGQEDRWYITLEQSVIGKNGVLMSATSFGRRLTYEQGYIQCSLANLERGFAELNTLFPWIEVQKDRKLGTIN